MRFKNTVQLNNFQIQRKKPSYGTMLFIKSEQLKKKISENSTVYKILSKSAGNRVIKYQRHYKTHMWSLTVAHASYVTHVRLPQS